MDIFCIPIMGKFLLYAPLDGLIAIMNQEAVIEVQRNLQTSHLSSEFVRALQARSNIQSLTNKGGLDPLFLGIIPTRSCNANCRYCDFITSKHDSLVMDLSIARDAINDYLLLRKGSGQPDAEIQFFGGEPFYAEDVVIFSVEYAALRAEELGLAIRFEATTNGLYRPALSRWVANHFDTVVLSLDGPKDIQDAQRPTHNGKSGFESVFNTAKLLSDSAATLILRACITEQTVTRMGEIAEWFCDEFFPDSVCFECMIPSEQSVESNLRPPDPWEFAENFYHASQYLSDHGIKTIHATAEIGVCRKSFCPLTQDALIVSPDGAIDACYLLRERWEQRGLNLRLGKMNHGKMNIFPDAINHVRSLNVDRRPLCSNCFCRYHCAGGCYVNNDTGSAPGNFNALCIQTRLITITNLLERLGQGYLVSKWMGNRTAMESSIWGQSDRLCDRNLTL